MLIPERKGTYLLIDEVDSVIENPLVTYEVDVDHWDDGDGKLHFIVIWAQEAVTGWGSVTCMSGTVTRRTHSALNMCGYPDHGKLEIPPLAPSGLRNQFINDRVFTTLEQQQNAIIQVLDDQLPW